MTTIAFHNVTRDEVMPRVTYNGHERRLDRIAQRHARGLGVPFLVSVHKPWAPLAVSNDSIFLRAVPQKVKRPADIEAYEERLQKNRRIKRDEIVLITILPEGGGGGNSAGKIGMTVAMLALMVFAPGIGHAAAGAMQGAGLISAASVQFAGKAIAAGLVIGAGALMAAVARKGNGGGQVYGVTAGGNLSTI